MNEQLLAGSPRLLRNLNEKAVLGRLLSEGALTRMELEAFTGLSKPAMSDLLRRLEGAGLVRRDGEKAGTFGPKAGLWALRGDAAYVAGVDVTAHGIDIAIADIAGVVVATHTELHEPGERYDASERMLDVLEQAAGKAGLVASQIDQLVIGLPGIVDAQTGHLRRGQQLVNWEGFHVVDAISGPLGHRRVHVENDVNLVALEELNIGAANGINSFVLVWIGEGVGGALVQGGKLMRGSTGSAGEIGGVLVPWQADGGGVGLMSLEESLSPARILHLAGESGLGADAAPMVLARAARNGADDTLVQVLADHIATAIAGAIGILDPDMIVLGGPLGQAGGRALARAVLARLGQVRLATPLIVPAQVQDRAVRAGAIELALEHSRERVFTGGSAARGLP